METRASYLLIGIFTLAGLFGSLALFLWLAKVQADRQFAYYDVLFESVSGLSNAGDVRYNGLPVGRVVNLRLDPENPSRVRVSIEVDAETPVRTDTVATLESLGVTGVSFVSLSGGSASAAALPEGSVITAEPSVLQSVLEGAPFLLQRAVSLLEDIQEVVNPRNREAVAEVLENVASASGRLESTLENLETLSKDLSEAATEVASFTGRLDRLADTAEITLDEATATLQEGRVAVARGAEVLETADATLKTVDTAFASATTLMEEDIRPLAQQGTQTAAKIEGSLEALEDPALTALERAETALVAAESTFSSAGRVIDGELAAIIDNTEAAVEAFREMMTRASSSIDSITEEILLASQSAANFTGTLESVAVENRRQMSSFLRLGLPEFVQFTEDARLMVNRLERFIERLDRDPARYFLGTQGSEFRR